MCGYNIVVNTDVDVIIGSLPYDKYDITLIKNISGKTNMCGVDSRLQTIFFLAKFDE